jgi:hypothetical protein
MQMRTRGITRASYARYRLTGPDIVTFLRHYLGAMTVKGYKAFIVLN